MKHKSDDYKISAVKYYLKNKDNIRNTCKIFDCSKSSLQRWIQMKYKEPTLGIGMRSLFRKNKYKVYLVDEFRTSCKYSKCEGGLCEKYMVRKNPRPNKDEIQLVHGLLRCKSGCGSWNRDRNGSSNIYKIAYKTIHKLERPSYLCREIKSNQGSLTSSYKQNIYKSGKTKL
jgi:hypothetical protein